MGQNLGDLIRLDDQLQEQQGPLEKEREGVEQLVKAYLDNPSFGNAASPVEQLLEIQNQIDLIKAQRFSLNVQIQKLEELNVVPIVRPTADQEGQDIIIEVHEKAKVSEKYSALAENEISVETGDQVTIIEHDKNGWTKVSLEKSGKIGLVPTLNILRTTSRERGESIRPSPSSLSPTVLTVTAIFDYSSSDATELCFKAGDIIECLEIIQDDDWWVGRVQGGTKTGSFPVSFTHGWEQVAIMAPKTRLSSINRSQSVKSNSVINVLPIPDAKSNDIRRKSTTGAANAAATIKAFAGFKELLQKVKETKIGPSARVLYAYDATCEGELTIEVGEVITDIDKETGSDAWWEGQGKHGYGQFPSNYVQELLEDGTPVVPNLKERKDVLKGIAH